MSFDGVRNILYGTLNVRQGSDRRVFARCTDDGWKVCALESEVVLYYADPSPYSPCIAREILQASHPNVVIYLREFNSQTVNALKMGEFTS
jgi:hypothetical protein